KCILSKLNRLIVKFTENLEIYELGIAVQNLYDFIWDEFCDWYIELVKPRLGTDKNPQNVLIYVLSNITKLLHPFMPFITEEIYSYLPLKDKKSIMISDWSISKPELNFQKDEENMEIIKNAIKSVRNLRAEMNVPPPKKAKLVIITKDADLFKLGEAFYIKLAGANEVIITEDKTLIPDNSVSVVVDKAEIFMPQGDLIDKEKEIERLTAEKKRLESEIKRVEGKLSNSGFVSKAPKSVVDQEKEKGEKYREMLEKVISGLEKLK
ncbi:MAG: class I tRNA ligase family protein, partial [Clostridia bacterium]|nr:class I tRNA ligase family protein [Clostridia bacterium]